ncbi:MarR family transcriptional regulator [Methylomonas methanica]|jgi:DNA-binding MarR family transcriptional regulator|uniref:MarR family transcriptional regulator n=1 Tax=Methylomonas methanica TaxID=421 RepID=A0A177MRR8_METMH|nr:MarR family transcriptional regulator [Methylomonas methanica]OAI09535.1 MarR family transcriptional regulator [Methylomonas methanica]
MSSDSTFPTVLRQLLRTHQAFLSYAARHVHRLELTLPQYDVIITLGKTAGMQPKKLGEETLITKGTLTGVVSRLEDKGLVERSASKKDGRSQIIRLTEAGRAVYEQTFPEHLAHIGRLFDDYAPEEISKLEADLQRLHEAVITARGDHIEQVDDEF